jgi:hypothetical protein
VTGRTGVARAHAGVDGHGARGGGRSAGPMQTGW